MKTILIAALAILTGCATLDPKLINDKSLRLPTDPLKLEVDWDPYTLRQDLVRATHVESRTGSGANGTLYTYSVTVENPYSVVVIDFGNGILMDANRNLVLDLGRAFGYLKGKSFLIKRKSTGFFDPGFSWEKRGDQFTLRSGTDVVAYGQSSSTELKYVEKGLFGLEATSKIVRTPEKIQVEGKFLGFDVGDQIKQLSPTSVGFPSLFGDDVMTLTSPTSIRLSNHFVMENTGDSVKITYRGLFGFESVYNLIRLADGLVFFSGKDTDFTGVRIKKTDKSIQILQNGELKFEYTIESQEP